jgi:hypothetical protein
MAAPKHSLKWLWIGLWMLGNFVLLAGVSILLWRQATATSYAQATADSTRFSLVSFFLIFWGLAPALLLARRKGTQ